MKDTCNQRRELEWKLQKAPQTNQLTEDCGRTDNENTTTNTTVRKIEIN